MNYLKFIFFVCSFSLLIFPQSNSIRGVDISFLKQIEDNNGVYKQNGVTKDALTIFKNHGVNYVRLRLWNNPPDGFSNLASTILLAKRVKQNGMKLLLDFHYSDSWADPSKQTKPALWNGISFTALEDSIYTYTKNILLTMKQESVLPDIVQIGNEITNGMLWNEGNVGGTFDTPAQWNNFTSLLNKGLLAVQEINSSGASIRTMIHIDRGGDSTGSKWFFDNLQKFNVQYDYIGLSFYPWWHGSFAELNANLSMLSTRYQKEIIIAETAYPWTLGWNDNMNNIVGQSSQVLAGYPATVDGQTGFLNAIKSSLAGVPNQRGLGYFYWEPDYISTSVFGSSWENLALFDFTGEVLSSIHTFEQETSISESPALINSFILFQNYPNPFNPSTKISFVLSCNSNAKLTIYNQFGQVVAQLINSYMNHGLHTINWNAFNNPSGIYFCELKTDNSAAFRKIILLK